MTTLKKDIFWLEGSVWAVLYLEDGGRFDHLYPMPLVFGYVHTVVTDLGIKKMTLGLLPEVVVKDNKHLAAQQDVGLSSVVVPVYRERCAGKQYVYQTLRFRIEALMEIIVHAQT